MLGRFLAAITCRLRRLKLVCVVCMYTGKMVAHRVAIAMTKGLIVSRLPLLKRQKHGLKFYLRPNSEEVGVSPNC